MSQLPDRYSLLLSQDKVTGIDFIRVEENQTTLYLFFFHSDFLKPEILLASLQAEDISVSSPWHSNLPAIPVTAIQWTTLKGRHVLKVSLSRPGESSFYRLSVNSDKIDPFYNDILFSFKVNCRSGLDCLPGGQLPSPVEEDDFPVDYMARDFQSFRKALLDFASLKYPGWKERLEADAGIMLAEVMSALGDELAFYQDQVAREAYLETAVRRRSVRRHARLTDYEIDDGRAASTWLDISVDTGKHLIPAGFNVWALSDSGERIDFETGTGMKDASSGIAYPVNDELNLLLPYIPDEKLSCLPPGTTTMYLQGHHKKALESFDVRELDEKNGKWILLISEPEDPSLPSRRHLVRLIDAKETTDPLNSAAITKITWGESEALPFAINMVSGFEIHGNLIPATAGARFEHFFVASRDSSLDVLPRDVLNRISNCVERQGRDGSVVYLASLPESDQDLLCWLPDENGTLMPEVELEEMKISGNKLVVREEVKWDCRRSFIGKHPSGADDRHFTLEDGIWKKLATYSNDEETVEFSDYGSGDGITLRFGDGEFGRIPAEGTVFRVSYRLGGGVEGNVPADAITLYNPDLDFVERVRNPLPAVNGRDPETITDIRKLSPFRFRYVTERAVVPSDYSEAAGQLPWVQKAGASFRWTGSWISAFVTPDPKNSVGLSPQQRLEMNLHLDRFRQAGREVVIPAPSYADIDLEITLCVNEQCYGSEVKEKVLALFFGAGRYQMNSGYFSPDRFTFGTKLNRSDLEAAIQAVPGVKAVLKTRIRRKGVFSWRLFSDPCYDPGKETIIRVGNVLSKPGQGSLKLIMKGGL